MSGKKGDLEVTIIEARNLGIKGHALYCSVELKTQRNTTNARTYYTTAARDAKWNQTFNLDLLSLDGEELLVQIWCKRNVKKDKFLGQSQINIAALNLSKEAQWHYLTDRPETELKTSDTLKRSASFSVVGNRGPPGGKKKDVYIISGEILFKLNFVHRLIRAKSKAMITKEVPKVQSTTPPTNDGSLTPGRVSVPVISPRTYTEFQAATAKQGERPTLLRTTPSNRSIAPPSHDSNGNAKEETTPNLNMQRSTPPEESPVDLSLTEEVIIDEALKEKQKIVKEKLEQGERLIRTMTSRIIKLETTEGEAAVREDKTKLEQIKKNMSELEKILESTQEQDQFTRPRSISHTSSARNIERMNDMRGINDAKGGSMRGLLTPLGREASHTISAPSGVATPVPPSRAGSKWDTGNVPASSSVASIGLSKDTRPNGISRNQGGALPVIKTPGRPEAIKFDATPSEVSEFANVAEEAKFLRVKVKFLEKNYETLQTANSHLEKEVTRLEKELERYQREERMREREEKIREREERLLNWERDLSARAKLPAGANGAVHVEEDLSIYDLPASEPVDEQTKAMQDKLKSLDSEIKNKTLRKNQLKTEAMKNAVRFKEETLRRINKETVRLEAKASQKINDNDSDPGSVDTFDSETDSSMDDDTTDDGSDVNTSARRSPNMRSDGAQDAKFDALVAKLEKLDKLDELLRKLDNMKMVGGGAGGGDSGDGRSYAELKAELETIQAIIFDETGKYTEKEKEDANIRYEKVSQDFQQTPEYKAEVAAALEEKRKVNEPLNKAALERMVKVYNADSIRDDAVIKDKVQKNPELMLIGMDPKAILSKHQNDFSQYMLRNLTLDELRAIRASLPKFRNDQKRQMDWMESLEQKIESVSKEPPKKAPAAKKAPAIKIKTKAAGSGGTDFLAELRAKQAKEAAERGEVVEEEKKEAPKPVSQLKLAPKSAPVSSAPVPPPPSAMHSKAVGAPPPPPPPPKV